MSARKNLNEDLSLLVADLVERGLTLEQARAQFERQFIVSCLRSHRGNLSRSADALGVHRNTLRNKVSRLGIEPRDVVRPRRRE
ncbi:MAG: helix-turn-helix domain-containing protein [Thermoanaerobaculia bacterium]|nr:helix-turn-helix domain-containing protein [Thermoanaerobaculia bacterium]